MAKALSSLLLCSSVSKAHGSVPWEAAATPVELRSGRTMGNLLPFPLPTRVPSSQKPWQMALPQEQLLSVAPIPQQDGKQGHIGDRIAGIHSVPQTNP